MPTVIDLYELAVKDYLKDNPEKRDHILRLYQVDRLDEIQGADMYDLFIYGLELGNLYTVVRKDS